MTNDRPFDIRDHMVGPAGFLGSAANVIMQLGWREVGYGVVESKVDSGNVMLHPWKRLRTTISYLVVALFGSEADRAAYREAVNRSHVSVRSGPDSPVRYNAFDPALQLWVAACLYIGFRDIRVALLGPMTEADADGLYAYCSRLGTSLQVPAESWPADREAFEKYWAEGLARVRYDEPVRQHLMALVELEMIPRWMRWGNRSLNRFATIGFLPPEFRDAMGLTWTPQQQRRFERMLGGLRFVSRRLPRWVRMLPIQLQLAEVRFRIRRGWRLT
ncbi:oxygenase MpaB family protein [Nocardioides pelophilus]|uniref:oxygenase MpaB family protein n=1 Tax=Nocardioides pelophilus TaxID=2172019 RepID=UPI0016046D48|nr:oxygenase MpaB family protein [Nocardioides pelophilus]